jgi:hypothetical protein
MRPRSIRTYIKGKIMKKRSSALLTLLTLSCLFLLTACYGAVDNPITGKSRSAGAADSVDTDADGLTDDAEVLNGTSPVLADSDGDGFGDLDELQRFGFDPSVNPFKFNPLVADVPRLGIVLRSAPSIRVFLEDDLAVTKFFEVDRTKQVTVDEIQNVTETVTESISLSQDTAQDTTFSGGVAGDVTITDSISKTMAESVEVDLTKEQAIENRKALTEIEGFEIDRTITASGGRVEFVVELENRGNIAFTVVRLILSVVIPDSSHLGRFIPVGNVVIDDLDFYSFPHPFTLAPGARFPAVIFINNTLDLPTVKRLLRDGKSVLVSVAEMELADADGVPFAGRFFDIETRCAQIVIDYAGTRPPERHFVATNADPQSRGITAGRALRDILQIPFEAGSIDYGGQQKAGLIDLRNDLNVRADRQKNSFWLAVRTRGSGPNKKVTRFNMLEQDFDFENILLKAGDTLYLVYMEDKDGDGIFSRQERLLGASDLSVDSDGDGLTDADEINVFHTDPNNPDTDGDGVIDSVDSAPLVLGVQ